MTLKFFPIVYRLLTQEFPDAEVSQVRTEQGWQQALATGAFDTVIADYLLPWQKKKGQGQKPCPFVCYRFRINTSRWGCTALRRSA